MVVVAVVVGMRARAVVWGRTAGNAQAAEGREGGYGPESAAENRRSYR